MDGGMRIISCSYLTANERQCQPKIGSLHDQVYDPKGRANALAVKDSAVTLELVYGVRVTVDKRRNALAIVGLGPRLNLNTAALGDRLSGRTSPRYEDEIAGLKGCADTAVTIKDSPVAIKLIHDVCASIHKRRNPLAVVGLGPGLNLDTAALDRCCQ